jgi:very-short-patch-repair endonuclease
MPDHDALRILTAGQHGLVGRRQLADLGFTKHNVASLVAGGRFQRLSDRVLVASGSPDTLQRRMMAASLDVPGSGVALWSAAARWQVPGFAVRPVHVLSDRRPHRGGSHLGIPHSTVHWAEDDLVRVDGIPVTTPARTIRDLASRIPPDRLSFTCDRMLANRALRLEHLHALGEDLPARGGAPGVAELRRLIERRPPGYRPAESNLERRFEAMVAEAGDPPFERQVDLGDDDGWIGRVDFVDRRHRIVVEVQSDLYHSGLVDRTRDRERIDRLRRAGWTVLEIGEFDIWHRRARVLARIRQARAAR